MAYTHYSKIWESEFDNMLSKKDKLQDININQLELEVYDTYRKDEKNTAKFEAVNDEDVSYKAYLYEEFSKTNGHLSLLENCYTEFKVLSNK